MRFTETAAILASGPTKQRFQAKYGQYRKGPASAITKTLVAEVNISEFKQKVLHMFDMAGDRRNNPDSVAVVPSEQHKASITDEILEALMLWNSLKVLYG